MLLEQNGLTPPLFSDPTCLSCLSQCNGRAVRSNRL